MDPQKIELRPGDYLFRQGDSRGHLYILSRGRLKVLKTSRGKEREVAEVTENQIVGELSFLDDCPRSASLQATEACELIELDVSAFKAYLDTQPPWLRVIIESLVAKLRVTTAALAKHK